MIEKILKDRIISIEELEKKLDKDLERIQTLKTSENEKLVNCVLSFEEAIAEAMEFFAFYKSMLFDYIYKEEFDNMEMYKKKVDGYDKQMLNLFKMLRGMEDEVIKHNK